MLDGKRRSCSGKLQEDRKPQDLSCSCCLATWQRVGVRRVFVRLNREVALTRFENLETVDSSGHVPCLAQLPNSWQLGLSSLDVVAQSLLGQ